MMMTHPDPLKSLQIHPDDDDDDDDDEDDDDDDVGVDDDDGDDELNGCLFWFCSGSVRIELNGCLWVS